MRVIAGDLKGLKLAGPKDGELRATQDRAKEGIFSALHLLMPKARVLDLFCGTGGLGLEALSRGAQLVVFVDRDVSYVKKNLKAARERKNQVGLSEAHQDHSERYLRHCHKKFDIIFMDPPWDDERGYARSLKAISRFDILEPHGIIVCEHRKNNPIPLPENFEIESQYHYGETAFSLFKKMKNGHGAT